MNDDFLQAGFEIKRACDALSRRLLRWHWEKTPRPHGLQDFFKYVENRTREAPDYYTNIPQSSRYNSWQQLDTTFCMRVLLDSETNASVKKDLLQYAVHSGMARRACNGLRIARNVAAHATDKADVMKAIALFDESLDDLEQGYGITFFQAEEFSQYDEIVKKARLACGLKTPATTTKSKSGSPKNKESSKTITKSNADTPTIKKKQNSAKSKNTVAKPKKKTLRNPQKHTTRKKGTAPKRKTSGISLEKSFVLVALMIFLIAILMRVR